VQGIASDFAANALLAELPPGFNQLFEIHCCNQSGKFSTGSRDLSLLNREIAGTKPRATPLSSDDMVSINQLVDVIEEIAGVKLKRMYDLDAPKVVRGRNSDNTLIKKVYQEGARLGTLDHTPGWNGEDLSLDP
jgi:hypothetical protein